MRASAVTLYIIVLCIGVRRERGSVTHSGSIWAKSVRELGEPASGTDSKMPLPLKKGPLDPDHVGLLPVV